MVRVAGLRVPRTRSHAAKFCSCRAMASLTWPARRHSRARLLRRIRVVRGRARRNDANPTQTAYTLATSPVAVQSDPQSMAKLYETSLTEGDSGRQKSSGSHGNNARAAGVSGSYICKRGVDNGLIVRSTDV